MLSFALTGELIEGPPKAVGRRIFSSDQHGKDIAGDLFVTKAHWLGAVFHVLFIASIALRKLVGCAFNRGSAVIGWRVLAIKAWIVALLISAIL